MHANRAFAPLDMRRHTPTFGTLEARKREREYINLPSRTASHANTLQLELRERNESSRVVYRMTRSLKYQGPSHNGGLKDGSGRGPHPFLPPRGSRRALSSSSLPFPFLLHPLTPILDARESRLRSSLLETPRRPPTCVRSHTPAERSGRSTTPKNEIDDMAASPPVRIALAHSKRQAGTREHPGRRGHQRRPPAGRSSESSTRAPASSTTRGSN
ncbi:hypothetical protein DFH06DRAFT_1209019 [Mycena polygramma]|nr:hypothetical protein DFH06DRAFT_1209019 [Mycena polygramma]